MSHPLDRRNIEKVTFKLERSGNLKSTLFCFSKFKRNPFSSMPYLASRAEIFRSFFLKRYENSI